VIDQASPHVGQAGHVVAIEGDRVSVVLDGASSAADEEGRALHATDFDAAQLVTIGQV
jgi:hypothetical protein